MNFVFETVAKDEPAGKAFRGRFTDLGSDKLRGGYYTPSNVSKWLCAWAIRAREDAVLEPSAGDGSFVAAAAERLKALGASGGALARQISAVELDEGEARRAQDRVAGAAGGRRVVTDGDFFAWREANRNKTFDAAVGNPPFIRYQSFPDPCRSRAMAEMVASGLKPNKLTNAWVPFLVAAVEALREGGRLAMVIPAELLQVSYAAQLRAYLTERFRHVSLVACNELFFEQAEQEVVLLLADDALTARKPNNPCRVAVIEAATVAEVLAVDAETLVGGAEEKDVRGGLQEKWLKYLLSNKEIGLLRALRSHDQIVDLGRLAEVDVGIVTGANSFFVLRREDAIRDRLTPWTHRLVSRSAHLAGAVLTEEDWTGLENDNERVLLLNLKPGAAGGLPKSAAAYVRRGEDEKVHLGYKCSIRRPWYQVPSLWNSDAFLFRQIHDFPRLVLNQASATATDTIHRVKSFMVDPGDLVAGAYTHLTAASAEIEGRSYGGGVLELEPTEAERLLVPCAGALGRGLPLEECDRLIRSKRLGDVLAENDRLVLKEGLGLSEGDCTTLAAAWERMRGRRRSRGRRPKGEVPTPIAPG